MKIYYNKNTNEIIDLYNSGHSYKKISKIIGCCEKTIANILKKNKIIVRKFNIHSHNNDFFKKIDSDEKAYVLGFIYADGSLNEKSYTMSIELKKSDIKILEEINLILKNSRQIRVYSRTIKNKKYESCKLLISNKELYNDLLSVGVTPRKSLSIEFPLFLDKKFKASFIRGYFDGDGSIYFDKRSNNGIVGIISTINFCNGINDFLIENNIRAYVKNEKLLKNMARIHIYNKEGIKNFYNLIYKDDNCICLERKKNKFKEVI